MGFLGSLFGTKSPKAAKSEQLPACETPEEWKEWFARTPPWQKVPAWLVADVVAQLPGNEELALFADAAMRAQLVSKLETHRRVEPRSVACAEVSGVFLRVGGPLAQDVLSKKRIGKSDERAALARDCLKVALSLYPDPPSAHPLLAVLLAKMGQTEEALEVAEDGLARVQDAIAVAGVDDPDDDFGDGEALAQDERQLRGFVDALSKLRAATAGEDGEGAPPRSSRVLVEYSRDEGKRGPDWMQNNVDPILGLYFTPQPSDPAWKQITEENVAAYQLWFQRALLAAQLHKAYTSESLIGERAEAVCKTAFKAKDEHGLNPLLVLILAHQYVDADQMLRGLHTVDWVAFMMRRDSCAPPPESVAKFVIDFYGLQRTP